MVQAILFAVVTAIAWGASDYLGGAAERAAPVFVVVAIGQLISLVVLAPVLIAHAAPPPADPRLLFACLAGLGVTFELRLIYAAISRGDAFITAPVGALGATLAVLVGLGEGDRLSTTIALGLALALLGGGISAWRPRAVGTATSPARNALTCLGAAAAVATMLASFHAAGRVDAYWSTTLVTVSTAVPATVAAVLGNGAALRQRLPSARSLPLLALLALAGVVGDLAYAGASRQGSLSIVSAISSLYPLSTIGLGVMLQGQRTRRLQAVGIALALAGAALLGAARGGG